MSLLLKAIRTQNIKTHNIITWINKRILIQPLYQTNNTEYKKFRLHCFHKNPQFKSGNSLTNLFSCLECSFFNTHAQVSVLRKHSMSAFILSFVIQVSFLLSLNLSYRINIHRQSRPLSFDLIKGFGGQAFDLHRVSPPWAFIRPVVRSNFMRTKLEDFGVYATGHFHYDLGLNIHANAG